MSIDATTENWRETFGVEDWTPPNRPSFRYLQKDNQGDLLIVSYHPSFSITWGWFVSLKSQKRTHFKRKFWQRREWEAPDGSGSFSISFLWLWDLSLHWQQLHPYGPAPMCGRCKTRIGPDDMMLCCQKGCKIPDDDNRRAVFKMWERERNGETL